ncbi:hypothetical protein C8Q74DRAFT_1222724 [Fomes fomentarius]|nr:hypothetical protein C8Q74DRAFT_1222724 [Fomes fomentarius]
MAATRAHSARKKNSPNHLSAANNGSEAHEQVQDPATVPAKSHSMRNKDRVVDMQAASNTASNVKSLVAGSPPKDSIAPSKRKRTTSATGANKGASAPKPPKGQLPAQTSARKRAKNPKPAADTTSEEDQPLSSQTQRTSHRGARQANASALTKDATPRTMISDPVHDGVATDDALSSDRDTPSWELNEEDSDSGNSGLDLNNPTDVARQLEAERPTWTTSRNIAGSGKGKVGSAQFINVPIVDNRAPRLCEHLFDSDAEDSDFEPSQHKSSEEDDEDEGLGDGEGEEEDGWEEDDDPGAEYEDEWMEVIRRRAERAAKNKVRVLPDSSRCSDSKVIYVHRPLAQAVPPLLPRTRQAEVSSNIYYPFVRLRPHPSSHISGAAMEAY